MSNNNFKVIFTGKINDQARFIPNGVEWLLQLSRLKGESVEVTISKAKKKRSKNQNSYYHGVVIRLLSNSIGYTPEEMHEACRIKFLTIHRNNLPDTIKSTTSLSTVEMEEYLENIRRWASEFHNIYLPLPNEVEY